MAVSKKKSTKKGVAGKKKASKKRATRSKVSSESDKTRQNPTDFRIFPKLDLEQEKAVVMMASGVSITETAKKLGVHRSTIYDWSKRKAFKDAWKQEEERTLEELRKLVPSLNLEAYKVLQTFLGDKDSSLNSRARVAEKYLKDSGFMVISETKEEQMKQVEEAAQIIASVMSKYTGES